MVKFFEEDIGKLGYGNMRLPTVDGQVDYSTVYSMIDAFIDGGFSYFDTSYVYPGSEEVLCEALVKRYPRNKFQITTKMSFTVMKSPDEMQTQISTSLQRLGVDFVDFYFLHALGGAFIKKADEYDAWRFLRNLKEKGIIKHIGFSFHGTPEELDELLTNHPYLELCQLQLNYLDWENPKVQSRRLYEVARSHNKPITVMEPNKGGWLASETSQSGKLLKAANPGVSAASWAFRYLLGLDGILTILTGMGKLEEVQDNIETFKNYKPLNEAEHQLILDVTDIINNTPSVPCTDCRYCVPHCPQKISIPAYIAYYNNYLVHKDIETFLHLSYMLSRRSARPSSCVKCGACEKVCPQHISIAEVMADSTRLAGDK